MTTKKTVIKAAEIKNAPAKESSVKKSPVKKIPATVKQVVKRATIPAMEATLKKGKKDHKKKVVRDSFTMPHNEYQKIAAIKAICLKAKMHVKKSEVLRAGLKILSELGPVELKLAMGSLEKIKTGRPKKQNTKI